MIPLGRVQNTFTDYLLSVPSHPSPSAPHNHRLWHQFSYWQLISPHGQEYRPRFHTQTNSDLVCLAGMRHCCLHIVLQLTMAEILLHSRAGRWLGTTILPCVRLSNIAGFCPMPQFAYPNFPTATM